jgi:starch phosphorylase
VERIRASMASLTGQFSTTRTVREYTEKFYLPAAQAYADRSARKGALGEEVARWSRELKDKWSALRFGEIKTYTEGGRHTFEAQVYLNGLSPDNVRIEVYASGNPPVRHEMKPLQQLVGTGHAWSYGVEIAADRPVTDYTARILPSHPEAAVPLEAAEILWQH